MALGTFSLPLRRKPQAVTTRKNVNIKDALALVDGASPRHSTVNEKTKKLSPLLAVFLSASCLAVL